MSNLGKLEIVDLRNQWPTEAQDFTPWLAREENLALLGNTLGVDLELEAVEQNVGAFRADILCKDTTADQWVLIENQLERTDHSHLGQLITYAAGLDAVTIVWISARIAEEHRAALDWLNEITDTGVRFFGLEVELWRIGDSLAAPNFNVVSKPNDWSRNTSNAKKAILEADLTPTRKMQKDYWSAVEALIGETSGPLNPVTPPAQSWLWHGIGKTGVALALVINSREKWARVEIYLTGKWAKGFFAQLFAQKAEIEAKIQQSLDWQELPGGRDSRICLILPDSDPFDQADWVRQHCWIVETAGLFHSIFRPYITQLNRNIDPDQEL